MTAETAEAATLVAAEVSAVDRADSLAKILAAARARVVELEQHAGAMAEKASACYRRADQEGGDQAHAAAVAAEADLVPARARLVTLEEAQRAVNLEVQREQWERQVVEARQREMEGLDELDRQLALIPAAVGAAKQAIRAARIAEEVARRAQGARFELERTLAGETFVRRATHNGAQVFIDSRPLLLSIERSPEF